MLGHRSSGFQQVPDIHHLLGQCPAVPDIFQQVPDIHHLLGKCPAVASSTQHRDFGGIWLNPDIFQQVLDIHDLLSKRPAVPDIFQQVPDIHQCLGTRPAVASSCQQYPTSGFWQDLVKSRHFPACNVLGHRSGGFQQVLTYICWVKAQQYPTFSSKYPTYTICWVNAQQLPAVPNIGIWVGFGLIPTFSSICNVLGHRSSRFQQVPDIIADSIMIASPFQIFSKSMSGFWRDLVKSRHNPTLYTQQEPNKIQQKPNNARQSPARTQQNPAITRQNPAFITQQSPAF